MIQQNRMLVSINLRMLFEFVCNIWYITLHWYILALLLNAIMVMYVKCMISFDDLW